MKNLMKFFSCLSLIIFLSTAPSLAPKATAQGADVVRIPFTGLELYNECTNEMMNISGVFNMVFKTTYTASGGKHIVENFNVQNASAVGENGQVYRATGSQNTFIKCSCGNGATLTNITSHQNFIAKGPGSNLAFTFSFHITMNANGDVTSFTPEVESFECQY